MNIAMTLYGSSLQPFTSDKQFAAASALAGVRDLPFPPNIPGGTLKCVLGQLHKSVPRLILQFGIWILPPACIQCKGICGLSFTQAGRKPAAGPYYLFMLCISRILYLASRTVPEFAYPSIYKIKKMPLFEQSRELDQT